MSPSVESESIQPPRPPNSWILYRRDKQKQLLLEDPGVSKDLPAISKIIGKMWREESEEIKFMYKKMADELQAQHQAQHPNYKYKPRPRGELKKTRRRVPYTIPKHPSSMERAAAIPNLTSTVTPASTPSLVSTPSSSRSTPVPFIHCYAGQPPSQHIPLTDFEVFEYYNHAIPSNPNLAVSSVAQTQTPSSTAPIVPILHHNRRPTPLPSQPSGPSHVPPMNEWVQYEYDPRFQVPVSHAPNQRVAQVPSIAQPPLVAYEGIALNTPRIQFGPITTAKPRAEAYAISSIPLVIQNEGVGSIAPPGVTDSGKHDMETTSNSRKSLWTLVEPSVDAVGWPVAGFETQLIEDEMGTFVSYSPRLDIPPPHLARSETITAEDSALAPSQTEIGDPMPPDVEVPISDNFARLCRELEAELALQNERDRQQVNETQDIFEFIAYIKAPRTGHSAEAESSKYL